MNNKSNCIKSSHINHDTKSCNTNRINHDTKSGNTNRINRPWIEKYRPIKLEDLIVDECTMNKIKNIIKERNMPNIIITGIPGIGKTTTILCVAKLLLGRYFKQGVLELNASDDRGIKAVQDSIVNFCKKKMEIDDPDNRGYAKHKIILLDEADNMTKKAQQLVNNLMGTYHKTTRFAFTCNNSSDIIEAIQSRCLIFRYKRLSNEHVIKRLKVVCGLEDVEYNEEGLDAIVTVSRGDMRQALNNLQTTFNGYKIITPDNVYKICDIPHPMIIQNIFLRCKAGDVKEALIELEKLRAKGYCSSDIAVAMFTTLKSSKIEGLDEKTKIKFMEEVGRTQLIISRGVNSPLQLTGCVCEMSKI